MSPYSWWWVFPHCKLICKTPKHFAACWDYWQTNSFDLEKEHSKAAHKVFRITICSLLLLRILLQFKTYTYIYIYCFQIINFFRYILHKYLAITVHNACKTWTQIIDTCNQGLHTLVSLNIFITFCTKCTHVEYML